MRSHGGVLALDGTVRQFQDALAREQAQSKEPHRQTHGDDLSRSLEGPKFRRPFVNDDIKWDVWGVPEAPKTRLAVVASGADNV